MSYCLTLRKFSLDEETSATEDELFERSSPSSEELLSSPEEDISSMQSSSQSGELLLSLHAPKNRAKEDAKIKVYIL